jgi:hypothetical protein
MRPKLRNVLQTEMNGIHTNHENWPQIVRLRLKCDGTRAEKRFRLSAKRTSTFKSAGGVSSVDY